MSLASRLTPTIKKPELFSDFSRSFDKNPITKNLARITNERAVAQSIRNLLLTDPFEVPFQPQRGSALKSMLFEPMDDFTANRIKTTIKDTLRLEPRIDVIDVVVKPSFTDNAYYVTIYFALINNSAETFSTELVFNRVR